MALVLCALTASAAEINFDSGGGFDGVFFETESESELVGGTMFIGTFAAVPPGNITLGELNSTFSTFQTHPSQSNSKGSFPSVMFSAPLGTTFPGAKIYLVVTDTPTIAAATRFAVFSSTHPSWTFPANDFPAPPSNITLAAPVDQFYAGSADTIDNPGGIAGTFNSIKLEPTATAPPLIPLLISVIVGDKPGVEFDYPTAADGTVSFALDESCTLLDEPSWSPVTSTPSVVSDNGTTQRICMLHPDLLTSAPKRYFRVTVTAL
ncbi:MAG: hypothetical protein O3A87_11735 [Verrucomicrobia bacterium]|nr:hypothetical protein [Verrucomicrobiota bacterium]MDA1007134.1 hypothetical protein [Verrucomicrobiota bacterium]